MVGATVSSADAKKAAGIADAVAGRIATNVAQTLLVCQKLAASKAWHDLIGSLTHWRSELDVFGLLPAPAEDPNRHSPMPPPPEADLTTFTGRLNASLRELFDDAALQACGVETATYGPSPTRAGEGGLDRWLSVLQPRLRVQAGEAETATVAFLLGAEGHHVGELRFFSGGVGLEVDLASFWRALWLALDRAEELLRGDGDKDPEADPETSSLSASGRLCFFLQTKEPARLRLGASILEPLIITGDGEDGAFRFELAARDQAWSTDADGKTGELTLNADLGALDLRIPYAALVDADQAPGEVDVHLPGLSFACRFARQTKTFTISNLGLGDSTATVSKRGGPRLAFLDLNPSQQRRLELSLRRAPGGGHLMLDIRPRLQLVVGLSLGDVRADLDADFPDYFCDETYSLSVSGVGGSSLALFGGRGAETSGSIKVAKGKLSLNSTRAQRPLNVAQGRFLVRGQRADEDHPILRTFESTKALRR